VGLRPVVVKGYTTELNTLLTGHLYDVMQCSCPIAKIKEDGS